MINEENSGKHILVIQHTDGLFFIYDSVEPWEIWDLIPKYGECKVWYICTDTPVGDTNCDFLSYWSVF